MIFVKNYLLTDNQLKITQNMYILISIYHFSLSIYQAAIGKGGQVQKKSNFAVFSQSGAST